jgi:O-antigen/teichoic acid export membrane protein
MNRLFHLSRSLSGHSVVKNSMVVMAGSVLSNILAYAYHVLVARMLGPTQYGELGALISIFYIINVPSGVMQNGLTKYFAVLKARDEPGQAKKLYVKSIGMLTAIGLVGLVLAALLMSPIAQFLHLTQAQNVVLLYLMFFTTLITVPGSSVFSGFQKFTQLTLLTNFQGIMRIVFGFLAAPFGVAWSVAATVMANFFLFLAGFIPLRFLLQAHSKNLQVSKVKALKYALPMSVAFLGVTALYSVDVVLVKHFFSSYEAGIYSSLSVLGKIIFFASFAITSVIFPTIAERHEKGEPYRTLMFAGAGVVAIISIVVTAFYIIFPLLTVRLLFGPSYDGAVPYIGLFAVFLSLVTLATFLVQSFLAAGNTRVALMVVAASVLQITIIWFYHSNLFQIIHTNIGVSLVLCLLLLVETLHVR